MNCNLSGSLFAKRGSLMMLWQEQAEQFYPERADFTINRILGEDFAAHLTSSFPLLCRRDLGDQIGVMLRPTAKPWFHMVPTDVRIEDSSIIDGAVLMPGVTIGRRCQLKRCIIDEGCIIPDGMQIGVDPNVDAKRFFITKRGVVLVSQDMLRKLLIPG